MNKKKYLKPSLNPINNIFNNSFYIYRRTNKIQKYEGVDGLIIDNCQIQEVKKNIPFLKKNKIKLDIDYFKEDLKE